MILCRGDSQSLSLNYKVYHQFKKASLLSINMPLRNVAIEILHDIFVRLQDKFCNLRNSECLFAMKYLNKYTKLCM